MNERAVNGSSTLPNVEWTQELTHCFASQRFKISAYGTRPPGQSENGLYQLRDSPHHTTSLLNCAAAAAAAAIVISVINANITNIVTITQLLLLLLLLSPY